MFCGAKNNKHKALVTKLVVSGHKLFTKAMLHAQLLTKAFSSLTLSTPSTTEPPLNAVPPTSTDTSVLIRILRAMYIR